MKKKLSVMAVIILVLAICVSAWFYGYYNRKSNDNLPTLTAIAEMSEADVNSLLPGYHIDQLREVWGKPDTSENSTACWKLGNDTTLVVSYKNNGIIAICGLKDDSGHKSQLYHYFYNSQREWYHSQFSNILCRFHWYQASPIPL